jgi:hypothetical protein
MLKMLEEVGLGFQMNSIIMKSIIAQVQRGVDTNKKDALVDYNSFWASKNLMMCRTEIEQYCMEDVEILSDTFDIFRGVKAVTVSGYW